MFNTHLSGRTPGGLFLIAVGLLIIFNTVHPSRRLYADNSDNGQGTVGKSPHNNPTVANAEQKVKMGQQTFRFDTFGDETFWGGSLKLHQAIEGSRFGGVGAGISPAVALSLGLKVDVDALPNNVQNGLKSGTINLNDPATTLSLLQLNAVVGVTGIFSGNTLTSFGIQCALCHSTVDDSFAPGIGHRQDGGANRDLKVGAIIAAAPDLTAIATVLKVDQPSDKPHSKFVFALRAGAGGGEGHHRYRKIGEQKALMDAIGSRSKREAQRYRVCRRDSGPPQGAVPRSHSAPMVAEVGAGREDREPFRP